MRVVFFGTPQFAVPSLHALLGLPSVQVVAAVSQPDRPHARSHTTMVAPPVKQAAVDAGISVLQPERPRGPFLDELRGLAPDLGVVVAYGHLLPTELLAIPRLGFVNVHASLLPRWRGAAPIHWAVLSGDRETGVSIMRVEAGLDSGAVWLQRRIAIDDDATTGSLLPELARIGATTLVDAMPCIARGDVPEPQQPDGVTLAPKVDRAAARIEWTRPADEINRLIRAMDPVPGAWTSIHNVDVKLFARELQRHPDTSLAPGEVRLADQSIQVGTGRGTIQVSDLQPSGRRRMNAAEWWRGQQHAAGARFV